MPTASSRNDDVGVTLNHRMGVSSPERSRFSDSANSSVSADADSGPGRGRCPGKWGGPWDRRPRAVWPQSTPWS
eukprot:6499324-Pyramimonas_sp.AAC.1